MKRNAQSFAEKTQTFTEVKMPKSEISVPVPITKSSLGTHFPDGQASKLRFRFHLRFRFRFSEPCRYRLIKHKPKPKKKHQVKREHPKIATVAADHKCAVHPEGEIKR